MKSQRIGKRQRLLVMGNWKMNPQDQETAAALALNIKKMVGRKELSVDVCIAPPFVFLSIVASKLKKSAVLLGAQTVSGSEKGAFTGEVSTGMLKGFGATHVIVGHSERRAHGQTDAQVHAQVMQVLRARMTAVLCVGELARDAQGDYFTTVEAQLRAALTGIPVSSLKNIVIAYEPVWAIGTGKQAHPEDVQEMKLFIQKCIAELFDRKAVPKVRIIYGGSVSKDTAQELLEGGNVDGFLIGGASLRADEFTTIVSHAHAYAHN